MPILALILSALAAGTPAPEAPELEATRTEATRTEVRRHGRVLTHGLPISVKDLVLTLERGEDDGFSVQISPTSRNAGPDFEGFQWTPVKEVPIAEDGTFSAQIPIDATYVRFVARGRFGFGVAPFEVKGSTDPYQRAIDLNVFLGGEVTLQLEIEDEATEQERRSLVGRRVTVSGAHGYGASSRADWPDVGGPSGEFKRTGQIDDQLRVVLSHMPAAEAGIVARFGSTAIAPHEAVLAPFYSPLALRFRAERGVAKEIVVPLRRAVEFSGVVVDSKERPIVGATLDTTSGAFTPISREWSRCVTDAEGKFRLPGLARMPEEVTVYAAGFPQTVMDGPWAPDPGGAEGTRITLHRGDTLKVRVRTSDGRPAHGVDLTVTDPGGGHYAERRGATDSEGVATFENLSGRAVTVVGSAVPESSSDAGAVQAEPAPKRFRKPRSSDYSAKSKRSGGLWVCRAESVQAEDEALELELSLAPQIQGVIQGSLPDWGPTWVIVARVGAHSTGYGLGQHSFAAQSLEDGDTEFRFELPFGSYHIAATQGRRGGKYRDMAQLRATPHVDFEISKPSGPIVLDFGLAQPMEGTVRLADGEPAAGFTVHINRSIGGYSDASTTVLTDDQGAFRSTPLLAGRYRVSASGEGGSVVAWSKEQVAFDPAQPEPVDLVAVSQGWVQIECEGDCADVRIASQASTAYWSRPRGLKIGGGRIGPRRPGTYAIAQEKRHPDGSITMVGEEVVVEEGKTAILKLGASPSLLARVEGVVSLGGKPVPGVRVAAHRNQFDLAWATTDLEGRYSLLVDGPGPMELCLGTLARRDFARRPMQPKRGGSSTQNIELPTGAIHLSLPVALGHNEWVRLRSLEGDGRDQVLGAHSGGSSAFLYVEDGRYELSQLDWDREVTARAEVEVINGAVLKNVVLTPVKD